jgi:hypothetical protein
MWALMAAMVLQPAGKAALPDWMVGCWESNVEGQWTEECWTTSRGGIMLGSNRSGAGEQLEMFEMMQIAVVPEKPGIAFWAAPKGVNRTKFDWAPSAEPGVTFVNPKNDYPQRIRYWREGEELHAEISLSDGSKPMRWRFSRPAAR